MLNSVNNSILDQIEEEEEEAKVGKPILKRVLPYIPNFFLFGGLFSWLLIMTILQFSVVENSNRTVMAEMESGDTVAMKRKERNYRAPQVILSHVKNLVPMLFRMSNRLPAELGGGPDTGVEVNGIGKLPKAVVIASYNLTEDGRLSILNGIKKKMPTDIWEGSQKLLRIYDLSEPVKTDAGYMVFMTASFYVVNKNGLPQAAETFNREVHLIPVEPYKIKLKPSPMEEIVNGLMKNGLMISHFKTRNN